MTSSRLPLTGFQRCEKPINAMKRIQLFEFEDQRWFPAFLRDCMTRYIVAFHRILGTPHQIAELVERALGATTQRRVFDLCSGGGGPLLAAAEHLRASAKFADLKVSLSDLYPNRAVAEQLNSNANDGVSYSEDPVDATRFPIEEPGVRTMICSLHHMPPDTARAILARAEESGQPFCAYEISDNAPPIVLWWLAIPFAFLITFFVTPLVRPLTFRQVIFTYFIPLLPFFIAWDGAVSNARTYTLKDLEELVGDQKGKDYRWEMGVLPGKGGGKIWLLGLPAS